MLISLYATPAKPARPAARPAEVITAADIRRMGRWLALAGRPDESEDERDADRIAALAERAAMRMRRAV